MATAALFLGIRAAGPHEWNKKSIARRVGILGAAALLGWLGTNPYAVITNYYFHSWVTTSATYWFAGRTSGYDHVLELDNGHLRPHWSAQFGFSGGRPSTRVARWRSDARPACAFPGRNTFAVADCLLCSSR